MNGKIIQTALRQLGVKEIAGPENNPTIINYAKEINLTWVNEDSTPWCAIFVGWVLMKCGYIFLQTASSRAYEKWGLAVTNPEPGDVVIFFRNSKDSGLGHVGFYLGHTPDGKHIFVLGGNQSNSVSIAKYPVSNLVCFRRAEASNELEIPEPILKFGDNSESVKKLQEVLGFLGLYRMKIDTIFGNGVKTAVETFQTQNGLSKTGTYDEAMKNKLFTILNE